MSGMYTSANISKFFNVGNANRPFTAYKNVQFCNFVNVN